MQTLKEEIIYALEEAHLMELATGGYDKNHVLETAQRLSYAPFSFVEYVAVEQMGQTCL